MPVITLLSTLPGALALQPANASRPARALMVTQIFIDLLLNVLPNYSTDGLFPKKIGHFMDERLLSPH
jgi:hypothetical protein